MQRTFTQKRKLGSNVKKFMHWIDKKLCSASAVDQPKRNSAHLPTTKMRKQQLSSSSQQNHDQS